ncbi:sulfatase-like hydrolase/transferase [Alloalcanivorax xenomutans]|uniref:sulfatase-like hydrolase/transferase n=1 Tax=Alloalcanivorax xenomutans TaxID=1094342 RepID=UPI001F1D85C6|nr:sulfatase-like hydrolase/transferase [Alloalcanivorax xenomutans]MCE7522681.1 sulfatase-like hydrolase/transferase [Alloalcanivorax xenomutans]
MKSSLPGFMLAGCTLFTLGGCFDSDSGSSRDGGADASTPPNILFIVVDDAGIDQFRAFGYGGAIPAETSSIDAIANAGVRFRNTWSMPTCSPTRATFFEGRYPFRNNVRNAIVSNDLANSQVSPYTLTVPRLLREEAGYVSALIGKMHLTGSDLGPENHPLGDGAMRELGWDYFAGYLDGAPYPIDTTGGGVAPEGTYQCGFVPNTVADGENGADFGVCYLADGEHLIMNDLDSYPTPGRTCVERGGLFDPEATAYSEVRRSELDFTVQNGYYTGEWKINHADGRDETLLAADPRARGYRTVQETDRAIDWITQTRARQPGTPWMLSLGYSALHAPLQPPPAALLPHPDADLSLLGCGTPAANRLAELGIVDPTEAADFAQQRAVAQHMLEAVDHEIGRLLVTTGIAERLDDGTLRYNPDSNTVVVFTSDNGTYMPSVKLPFDPVRAKGSLYQSGVWVPLVVAGPESIVNSPDRDVPHMVNNTDLFSLFREIAGIGEERLPASVQLDARPVMPYLTEPDHQAIRDTNFSELGTNFSADPAPPCVIPGANVCVEIFPQQGVCEDQSGIWYGPGGAAGADGFDSCCAVNDYRVSQGEDPVKLFPHHQSTLRDEHYKLVRISRLDCATDTFVDSEEFYQINESPDPLTLKLDREDQDLLADKTPDQLTATEQTHYAALSTGLTDLLAGDSACPGDGNDDGVVDATDLERWAYWADPDQGGGLSSWYDVNLDGLTDTADRDLIEANMGQDCRP